jgi:hypothetical protein
MYPPLALESWGLCSVSLRDPTAHELHTNKGPESRRGTRGRQVLAAYLHVVPRNSVATDHEFSLQSAYVVRIRNT